MPVLVISVGHYATEDWRAYYWVVTERGDLMDRRVIIPSKQFWIH